MSKFIMIKGMLTLLTVMVNRRKEILYVDE